MVGKRKTSYITDFRYVLEARKGLRGIAVVRYMKSKSETLFRMARQQGVGRLGFDPDHITLAQYQTLSLQCSSSIKLAAVPHPVETLRETKDAGEIRHIREALTIHKEAYKLLCRVIRPRICERDIVSRLEDFIRHKGARFSFPPIVASGSNSCYPHAKVTRRKLGKNDIVLVDIGIEVKGYKSDLTRMFFLGRIPPFVQRVNDAVGTPSDMGWDSISTSRHGCPNPARPFSRQAWSLPLSRPFTFRAGSVFVSKTWFS